MKNLASIIFSMLLFLGSCQNSVKIGEEKALKWCECNQAIVPLVQKLEEAQSPGQRQSILDSLRQVVAEVSLCMGGDAFARLDKEMSDAEKNNFNKTFRRVSEEHCPNVFQALDKMEQGLQKK